jgi:hypothetical protein
MRKVHWGGHGWAQSEGCIVWQIAAEFVDHEVVDGMLADHLHVAEVRHGKPGQTLLRFGACGGIVACLMGVSDAMLFCCRLFWCLNCRSGFDDIDSCYTWQQSLCIGLRVALVSMFSGL